MLTMTETAVKQLRRLLNKDDDADKALRVYVTPGGCSGFSYGMSLEDDTQLISTASETYNRSDPDEVRIPPESFGDVWTIKGR